MHSKPYFVYENKTVFVYFLTISSIIHLIFIFSTSSLSYLLKPALNSNDKASKINYVIEIDLEPEKEKEESIQNEEESKEEVKVDSLPKVSDSEELPVNNEIESLDEMQEESVLQDVKAEDVEAMSSQA